MAIELSKTDVQKAPLGVLSRDALSAALRKDRTFGYARIARVLSSLIALRLGSPSSGSQAPELRALLVDCAELDFALGSSYATLPPPLAAGYRLAIARIRTSARSAPDTFFSVDNDSYIKDLAVCVGHLYPGGARLIDLHSGLPRRMLLLQGAALPSVLGFFLRAGGFHPWFETHVDPRDLSEFSPPGLTRMYLRVAALLEANPHVHGVFGGSWFYDPQLETLSPHLVYLQEMPRRHGARLLRWETTPGSVRSALLKSKRRREAFERGIYRPANYFLAWPRRAVLEWASKQRATGLA